MPSRRKRKRGVCPRPECQRVEKMTMAGTMPPHGMSGGRPKCPGTDKPGIPLPQDAVVVNGKVRPKP